MIAGSKGTSLDALRRRIRVSESSLRAILDQLQRRYFVDAVSYLQDGRVVGTYQLTDDGVAALEKTMELMCELPEL